MRRHRQARLEAAERSRSRETCRTAPKWSGNSLIDKWEQHKAFTLSKSHPDPRDENDSQEAGSEMLVRGYTCRSR